ncbi:hypothetical protein SCP_1601630 [Sparassis crispa]|uniref:BTB domain-containing protein n=1 Tax=Sparassis crispa TaxID=139825 RepID=A0A401H524_9APHY|nr:hypothetical protein SCP_1601630 [Sparassis crispa]GBE89501.1 hypothetical protein SCP_1601630 [Sparassis crispa]
MEPSQSPLPRWAQHPFDNPVANIILHSDNIDFCVHSVILSEASRTCSASSSPSSTIPNAMAGTSTEMAALD